MADEARGGLARVWELRALLILGCVPEVGWAITRLAMRSASCSRGSRGEPIRVVGGGKMAMRENEN